MSTFVLLLDEIANDFVVEINDGLPFDALSPVLVLFGAQRQIDEKLLELLVAVVDAQLFEAIAVENLEAVDVEDAKHDRSMITRLFQRPVESLNQPAVCIQ